MSFRNGVEGWVGWTGWTGFVSVCLELERTTCSEVQDMMHAASSTHTYMSTCPTVALSKKFFDLVMSLAYVKSTWW